MSSLLPSLVFAELPAAAPAGHAFIALTPEQQSGAARLGVVVQTGARPGLIVLRESLDSRVYLGAIADAAGRVHQYVEVWVQDVSGLAGALPTYRQNLSNRQLDERWRSRARALDGACGGGRFTTGWEESHPEPIFVDFRKLAPVRAADKSGGPWALCEDDEFLKKKGKEPYTTSLSRYLYCPMLGERSPLTPVSGPEAGDASYTAQTLGLPGDVGVVSLGGLMMVLPLSPMSYEQYVDALGGAGGEGTVESQVRARAAGANGEAGRGTAILSSGSGWLGAASASPARRLPEVLHLKLRLLAEAVGIVRSLSAEGPMLNVSADSFRVRLAEGGAPTAGLPTWWTGRVTPGAPGEAVKLPIPGSQAGYFVSGSDRLSIYSASTLGRSTSGRGVMRIRRVVDASLGSSGGTPPAATGLAFGTVFECTLGTQERVGVGANDLVWLRFSLGSMRVDAYAAPDARAGLGGSELRLRSLAQELPAGAAEKLNQAAGVPIPDVMFEVLPMLSTPCDLYSLGVLAVRTLLVNGGTTLPVAIDEVMSLASAVAAMKPPEGLEVGAATAAAVGEAMAAQPRFLEALGCQRLVSERVEAGAAAAMVPAKLWHEVLGLIVRMFPGPAWFARCKHFGDAPAGAPQRVYDGTLDGLHGLMNKTRSLIVPDQAMAREVHQVLKELLVRA